MNTKTIDRLLQQLVDPAQCNVLGVFPRDLVPVPSSLSVFPACLVANTDKMGSPGQHWVSYYYASPDNYEFFDSYGFPPNFYSFSLSQPNLYNHSSFQPLNSLACGQFSLYYCCVRSQGATLDAIINSFNRINHFWNERFVKKFILKYTKPSQFYATQTPSEYNQVCKPYTPIGHSM